MDWEVVVTPNRTKSVSSSLRLKLVLSGSDNVTSSDSISIIGHRESKLEACQSTPSSRLYNCHLTKLDIILSKQQMSSISTQQITSDMAIGAVHLLTCLESSFVSRNWCRFVHSFQTSTSIINLDNQRSARFKKEKKVAQFVYLCFVLLSQGIMSTSPLLHKL